MPKISVDLAGNLSGFQNEKLFSLLRPERLLGVSIHSGWWKDIFWCDVSGVVAVDLIRFYSAFLRMGGRAGVAYCKCPLRIELSSIFFFWLSCYSFSSLERSCVLIKRHGYFGPMKKVSHVHVLLSANFGCIVDCFCWRKTAYLTERVVVGTLWSG